MSQIIKETEKLKKLKAYGTITSKDTVPEIQPSILKKKEFVDSCIDDQYIGFDSNSPPEFESFWRNKNETKYIHM